MIIRLAQFDDLTALQTLVINTIKSSCKSDYNPIQIEAWISGIEDEQRWQNILKNQLVLIAQDGKVITGLCTLAQGNYIDLFYVHHKHQRKGIANRLYAELEKEAKRQDQEQLTANVSKTARHFFEKVGFELVNEQSVKVKGVALTNFRMAKRLAKPFEQL